MDYLHSQDIEVERKRVEVPEAGIKTVGTHTVYIKLYGGERATLKITVTAEGEAPKKVNTQTETVVSGSPEPATEEPADNVPTDNEVEEAGKTEELTEDSEKE